MPGILTFKTEDVRALLEHAQASSGRHPSYEDLFNPAYHQGGVVKYREDGWPDQDNLDRTKIPAGVLLVKDQGVYCMSNGTPGMPSQHGVGLRVAYAQESDPTNMPFDEWYDAAAAIVGGDDCAITLEAELFVDVMSREGGVFRMRIEDEAVFVLPPSGA